MSEVWAPAPLFIYLKGNLELNFYFSLSFSVHFLCYTHKLCNIARVPYLKGQYIDTFCQDYTNHVEAFIAIDCWFLFFGDAKHIIKILEVLL